MIRSVPRTCQQCEIDGARSPFRTNPGRNAVRLSMLCERLFSGFWTGEEVPRQFYTASENLRRQLSDLGLEPHQVEPDVAAILARMRAEEGKR